MKKIVTAAALLWLAGCEADTGAQPDGSPAAVAVRPNGLPITDRTIMLRIPMVKQPYFNDLDDMITLKRLEQKTNIDIEWKQIPVEGFKDRINLMLASGELPDAFFYGLGSQDVVKYGSQGTLIPLEDLIERYAPNISRIFDEYPQVRRTATAPDGHIYSLPWFKDQDFFEYRNTFLINQTWLDTLGLRMPETTEQFYDVLKAFKERDPNGNGAADEIPATFRYNVTTNGYYELFGAFGVIDAVSYLYVQDRQVKFEATGERYKEAIRFLHRLYAEGLLDPETFTQDTKQLLSKTKNDVPIVGVLASFNGTFELDWDRLKTYVPMPPLQGPHGDRVWRRQDNRIIPNYFSITSANRYPEATMRLVDVMNEPKSVLEFQQGPFGTHLKEREDGKIEVLYPPPGTDIVYWIGSVTPSTTLPLMISKEWMSKVIPHETDQLREQFYRVYKPYIAKEEETYPSIYLTAEQNKRVSILGADINKYVRQMEAKWIVQGGVDADWDDYVAELNRMGLGELMRIRQKAYDQFYGYGSK
ncbi:extracellular solute-binding protein [Paenibacillus ginsengarvi]|uniref:Extracellular solute-binding protein n=1 Tax=Paenibacillus ginsengarvi TaxID=400777 RepID=A0A3B0CL40_9BACL|nr:extracellular solute-binding protein [Paenibacillus ginsengarvi]RKN85254.1 extracellular solute-binding protein [Paenibacillus ginsengarvi]